jgi:hypothetical protein
MEDAVKLVGYLERRNDVSLAKRWISSTVDGNCRGSVCRRGMSSRS